MIGIVIFIFTDFVYDISFMHWVVLGRRGLGFTSDFILHYLKILFPFFFFSLSSLIQSPHLLLSYVYTYFSPHYPSSCTYKVVPSSVVTLGVKAKMKGENL